LEFVDDEEDDDAIEEKQEIQPEGIDINPTHEFLFLALESNQSGFLPPPPVEPQEDSKNSMRWDFRDGILPPGVEVVGSEPEFVLQKDGSTALFLPPMSYLKVRNSFFFLNSELCSPAII
jgi:hypothetical protein